MKKLILFLMLLVPFLVQSQVMNRVVAKQVSVLDSIYINNAWIRKISMDTADASLLNTRYLPNMAVIRQLLNRIDAGGGGNSFISRLGGINTLTSPDSSLLFYIKNNLSLGTRYNQFVLTNTTYANIPSIYEAKGGSHGGTFNPSQLLLVRKFNEALNDTLLQMPYGGATTAYTEYRTTNGSTRFRYDNKHVVLPNYGFYSDGRWYPGADSVEVRTNGNGQSGSGAVQAMSIGDVWGYNLRINSTQYAPYPLANNISTYDFMRNDSRGLKRQITGNGVAGYVADWKGYQYGDISVGTNNDNSYINRVYDFYSMGGRDDTVGTDKTKIMQVSKIDSMFGFYSRQKYHPFNEVWNGYGFVQDGVEDYNHFQGRVKIGLGRPNRNAGGIAQNLLVEGSMRSDSIFNRYTKFDSTGRIVFTEKNDPSLNGVFLVQVNQTLDSNANQFNVAGGVRSYRNWLDAKNILIPEPTIDARNYYRIANGRTSTLQNCTGCSLAEYFGYKQVILGAGSVINHSGIEPRIFWARNEVNGNNVVTKGKAKDLNLTGFANLFVAGPNVDTIGILYGFKEDGIIGNTALNIVGKYSFYDASVYQSNVTTQYGFYQVDNRIRNRFSGLVELGSNIRYLSKDSVPYTASIGSRQMMTIDTVTGEQYRMDIPAGGGGGGLSGLTTNRVLFAGSSTTAVDDAGLTYNSTINELTTDTVKGKAIYGDSGVFVPQGRYDSDNSFWRPGIRFIGENKTGIARLAGITTFIDNGAKNVGIWREGADTDVIFGYGANRLTVEATGSMNHVSLVGRMEFEGLGNGGYIDWVGYQAGSSLGRTIRITTDASSYGNSVVPIHFVPRNHFHAFRITDSVNAVKTHFNYQGWLGIGNDTATTPLHIRSEAASDIDGAVITLDGVNLSNQGIRARYWSGGSPVTIWEEIANLNTGEVKNFIKAGGGYFHTWYSNGVKSMTLNNSGNLSIGTTANTYKLDVNGTGNFSGKLQLATTSTTIAPLNIGGFGTLPTSPSVGDIAFDVADSSMKIRIGTNWLPFQYTKPVVGVEGISIRRSSSWNVADTIGFTLPAASVTYTKMQNVSANSFLANATGSSATVQEIATNRIPLFSSAITGTPSSTTFLRGDGSWQTVSGGSGDMILAATQIVTGQKTFTTNDVLFSSVSPLISGTGALKFQDGNDGKNFSMTLNTRKLLLTAQQSSFSYQDVGYWMVDAPANAFSLWSTGTWRLNTTSTAGDIESRKLYVNGSVGVNKDSLTDVTLLNTENVALVDNTTGQVKKITKANLEESLFASVTGTPTITNITNIGASSISVTSAQRIGDRIYYMGEITIDPTATGNTKLSISQLIASATGASTTDISGSGTTADNTQTIRIYAGASGAMVFELNASVDAASHLYSWTASVKYIAP